MVSVLLKLGFKGLARKIRGKVTRSKPSFPESDRTAARLPRGGAGTSVETALNSRCSSDDDDDPTIVHWGMFDRSKYLIEKDIETVLGASMIRRFTPWQLSVRTEKNVLAFASDPRAVGIEKDWLMMESGMRQQAVSLACAALGIGTVILSLGPDGRILPFGDLGSVRMRIGPMKPSYQGSYWTSSPPTGLKKWRKDYLPEPDRVGIVPLLAALRDYPLDKRLGRSASISSLGQLLWAARGRTPHFYKAIPWGLTIPVWNVYKDTSNVLVLAEDHLFQYKNRGMRRPSHSLKKLTRLKPAICQNITDRFSPWNCLLVLNALDAHARSLWEVGYQLLNLAVQSVSLDLSFQIILLDEERRDLLAKSLEMTRPVAVIGLRLEKGLVSQL